MKKFWSKGFTITELMVSLGMLGGVSLLTMRIVQEQSGQDAISRYKAEIHLKMNELESFLSRTDKCTEMFTTIPRTFGPAPGVSIPAGSPLMANGKNVMGVGSYPYFDITRVALITNPITSSGFDIEVVFAPKAGSSVLSKYFISSSSTTTKRVSVIGTTSGTTITSCGPIVTAYFTQAKKKLCDDLAGMDSNIVTAPFRWNAGTSSCRPLGSQCAVNQVPSQITRLGQVACRPVNTWIDYNAFFDWNTISCASKTYSLIVNAANKIQMVCAATPAERANTYTYPYP